MFASALRRVASCALVQRSAVVAATTGVVAFSVVRCDSEEDALTTAIADSLEAISKDLGGSATSGANDLDRVTAALTEIEASLGLNNGPSAAQPQEESAADDVATAPEAAVVEAAEDEADEAEDEEDEREPVNFRLANYAKWRAAYEASQ